MRLGDGHCTSLPRVQGGRGFRKPMRGSERSTLTNNKLYLIKRKKTQSFVLIRHLMLSETKETEKLRHWESRNNTQSYL